MKPPLDVEPGRGKVFSNDEPVCHAVEAAVSKIRREPYNSSVSREVLMVAIEVFLRHMKMDDLGMRVKVYDLEQVEMFRGT